MCWFKWRYKLLLLLFFFKLDLLFQVFGQTAGFVMGRIHGISGFWYTFQLLSRQKSVAILHRLRECDYEQSTQKSRGSWKIKEISRKYSSWRFVYFVFLKTWLLKLERSGFHLNFIPRVFVLKRTLEMDDKAAFLCQTKNIHHSAQSN